MKKKYICHEAFRMGHSLIMGDRPIQAEKLNKIDINKHLQEVAQQDVEAFGLFDSTSPNFVGYYPDVTAEDLKPKDDEFIYPVFRALSNVIVRPNAPIDFGASSALKDSLQKLVGQTVFPNHEMVTGDELGAILKAEWAPEKTVKLHDGSETVIPAGINVTLKLDGKSNPKIARAIMMDPPAIHSVSVTVEFEWEQSHPEMEREEFMNKMGTHDGFGSLIKRNVSGIKKYHEISLVPHGADPFAQKINEDGNIVNPDYANTTYSFSDEQDGTRVLSSNNSSTELSFKGSESFSVEATIPEQLNNQNTINLKQDIMLKELSTLLGLTAENPSESEVMTKLKESLAASSNNIELLATADGKVVTLTAELAVAKEFETVANLAVTAEREEAIRLCQLANDGKADEGILAVLGTAGYATASTFKAQYQKMVDEKFGEGTVDLGEGDPASDDPAKEDEPQESLTMEETVKRLQEQTLNTSNIHGNEG